MEALRVSMSGVNMSLHGLDIWIVRLTLWSLMLEISRLAVLAQSPDYGNSRRYVPDTGDRLFYAPRCAANRTTKRTTKRTTTSQSIRSHRMINERHTVTRASSLSADGLWIPEGPGKWSRPLRFLKDGRGWVELMRLAPGTKLGLHRHTGEVHAFNLEGQRRLCTGEIVEPGDYVHESTGNVDWWGGGR
ncbi:cupin domain-containing protein [Paraburkholderia nemoris]|uniref:cupin domain-containing protein n=1 Tax=Paraburkholderia nemoris TaxID=2793076 RepID=UPI0038B9CCAA